VAQNRFYSSATRSTTTTADPGTSGTTLTVVDSTVFSSLDGQFPWTALINWGLSDQEIVNVTARPTGTTLTIVRAQDGTAGQAHAVGATVNHGVSARDFTEAGAHIGATTGVHGVGGSVVGTSGAQTLSGKTFSDTPTIGGGLTIQPQGLSVLPGAPAYVSCPRWALTTTFTPTSGTLYMTAIELPAGLTISNLFISTDVTAAASQTHAWLALFDSSRVMLAVTADKGSTAFPATTFNSAAIATTAGGPAPSFTTTYAGLHYVGWDQTATTMGALQSIANLRGQADAGQGPPISGPSTTGLTTPPAFPFTAAAIGGSPQLFLHVGVG
jgi:hypothetical protein